MENTIVSGNRRTFMATLFGVVVLMVGGAALAATAPAVAPLKFEYTAKDANGNTITLENKIATGYEASRVAVDGNGNVYVTDAVSNTVSVFNTNGKLVKRFDVNRAFAVGADSSRGLVYVGGALNGTSSIFILDNNNDGKDDSGNLGTGWGRPMGITITPSGDVYVADAALNIVRKIDVQGATRDYGPFGGEMYASTVIKDIYLRDTTFSRTRHRMLSPQGTAVDGTNGLLYVSIEERVEFLSTTCQSTGGVSTADGGGTGTDTNCSNDTEESWKTYNTGVMTSPTDPTIKSVPTDSTYRYWNPVNVANYPDSARLWILVVDINAGTIKSKIMMGNGSSAHIPRGLALDGKGRLYVATTGGGATGGRIKVYNLDANPVAELTVSGFSTGVHTNVAFSPDAQAGAPKGRIFATMGDSKTVSSYSIDGGTNPANTAPTAPVLLEPASNAVAKSTTPMLRIKNAADKEKDPLTYAYEIYDNTNTKIDFSVNISEGHEGTNGNETSISLTSPLAEDSLYHWRTQSFDGEKGSWSDEAAFCVDVVNSNPSQPSVGVPLNRAVVSPYSSSLSWSASSDFDCSNDTITYEVAVSDSQGNILKSFIGLNTTSIKISDISGLISGNVYNWAVRATDNRGGSSEHSSGSFTYMTTSVTLDSDQAGTKAYMDGNYGYYGKLLNGKYDESGKLVGIKSLPVDVADVIPGSHFVAFVTAGYEPHYAIINVTDPALDAAYRPVTYTATMVAASRIKLPADSTALNLNLDGNAAPFVVNYDYDKDGLKDIVAGGKVNVYNDNGEIIGVIDGKVYLYISEKQVDGTSKLVAKGALQASGVEINVGSKAVPFMADYDNDGHPDLLVGSVDGGVYLYKGTANGFVAAGTLALKDGDGNDLKGIVSNLAPAVVDYNNDARKDLVVGSSDGALRLYINTGTDESPEFGVPVTIKADGSDLNVGSNSKAFFTDWNSDGKKDLVVGRGAADLEWNTVNLFLNVGTDEAPDFKSISGLKQWIKEKKKERGNRDYVKYLGYNQDLGDLTGGKFEASPFVVDWDGSSARDVIVGNGSGGVAAYITE